MKIPLALLTVLALASCDDSKDTALDDFTGRDMPEYKTPEELPIETVPGSGRPSAQESAKIAGEKFREAVAAGADAAKSTYQEIEEETRASRDTVVRVGKQAEDLIKAHGPALQQWAKDNGGKAMDALAKDYEKIKDKLPPEADALVRRVADEIKTNGVQGVQNAMDELKKMENSDLVDQASDKASKAASQVMDFLKQETLKAVQDALKQ